MPTTRRSISITGVTYERLKLHAEHTGDTCSGLAEKFVAEILDALGVRTFTIEQAEARRPKNGGARLPHPDKRANETARPHQEDRVLEAREEEEDIPPREARPAKEPTLALVPSKDPLRGGGVHSF
jgi:hypothetical protein